MNEIVSSTTTYHQTLTSWEQDQVLVWNFGVPNLTAVLPKELFVDLMTERLKFDKWVLEITWTSN